MNLIVEKTLPQEAEKKMKERFLILCQSFAVPEVRIESYYNQLYNLYNLEDRYYHNLVHIWNFLGLLDEFLPKIDKPRLFELAIWYHDAIYIAKKKDNELQSALLIKELFVSYLSEEDLSYIDTLIMSTAGHHPREEHTDCYYFLDFDLAILANDKIGYSKYSEAIWQEYKTAYPKILYKMGRKKVLKSFILREKLYFSHDFYQKYEEQARENLQYELNSL